MKVLVTGGTGFIGRHLVNYLEGKNNEVVVLGFKNNIQSVFNKNIKFISGNITDKKLLEEITNDVEIVYHLAWNTYPYETGPLIINDVQNNIVGSINLLEASITNNVKRIIFLSSGGTVYGNINLKPAKETDNIKPLSAYGVGKIAVEEYIQLYSSAKDIEHVILRASNVYGEGLLPNRGQGLISTVLWKILNYENIMVYGDGSIVRDYIYVSDVIEACYLAGFQSYPNKIYNVGSNKGLSINQLLDTIKEVTKTKFDIDYLPGRKFDIPKIVLDNSLLKADLHWDTKVNIYEGIEKNWKWMKRYYLNGK